MPPNQPPASEPQTPTKKILLVEDDDNLAEMYVARFAVEGFDVKRVPDGEDALAAAITYRPDLVVLDVMMPKISGFDVLDILRNTPETAGTKIIMLSARGQDSDQQRAISLGADEYLIKSQVMVSDVVTKIQQHLARE
jgi:DNA-binding response OmpR family regulator